MPMRSSLTRFVAAALLVLPVLVQAAGSAEHRIDLGGPSALSVAFSPDGDWIALGLSDGSLRLVGGESLEPIHELPPIGERIGDLMLAPSRDRIAAGYGDGTIRVWDIGGWQVLLEIAPEAPVTSLAFSHDGAFLVSGSEDGSGIVWETKRGWIARELRGHRAAIRALAWSPVENLIATGSDDGSLRVFELGTEQPVAVHPEHGDGVYTVGFSPDGRFLASGGTDGNVRLWSTADGMALAVLSGHEGAVTCVAFRDDASLVSGGIDGTVRVWDLAFLDEALERDANGAPAARPQEPTERANSTTLATLGASVQRLAVGPSGRRLVATSLDSAVELLPLD